MNSSELWRHKKLALALAACFFLTAPAPALATSFPKATDATVVLKPVSIIVDIFLQLGRVLAPTPSGSPTVFNLNRIDGNCSVLFTSPAGDGECMSGGIRSQGELQFTGHPFTTVFISSNIPNPGSPSTTSAGVPCTGGSGTTPPKLTNVFFDSGFVVLNSSGTLTTSLGVGAWFAVWDTSAGTLGQDWNCAYSISADY